MRYESCFALSSQDVLVNGFVFGRVCDARAQLAICGLSRFVKKLIPPPLLGGGISFRLNVKRHVELVAHVAGGETLPVDEAHERKASAVIGPRPHLAVDVVHHRVEVGVGVLAHLFARDDAASDPGLAVGVVGTARLLANRELVAVRLVDADVAIREDPLVLEGLGDELLDVLLQHGDVLSLLGVFFRCVPVRDVNAERMLLNFF